MPRIDFTTRNFVLAQGKSVSLKERVGFYRWMIRILAAT